MRRLPSAFLTMLLSAGAVALTLSPQVAAAAVDGVNERVPASKDGRVRITAVAVSLEIVGTDKAEVRVEGELPEGTKLELQEKSGSVDIRVRPPRGRSGGRGQLTVYLPRDSQLETHTVAGHVKVKELKGEVELETVSGSVELQGHPKELTATTVSGNVEVDGAIERTRLRAVSGRVVIRGAKGRIEANVVSGNLQVKDSEVERSEFQAVSGRVEFQGRLLGPGPHEIVTHAGRVKIVVPAKDPMELTVGSHAGSIHDKIGGQKASRSLKVRRGEGGPVVKVRTFAGSVEISAED